MQRFLLYVAPITSNSLLRLASIYITSHFVGPEEFGQAALFVVLATLVGTVAGCTTGYLLNEYCTPHRPAPPGVVTTALLIEAGLGSATFVLMLGGVAVFHNWLPELQPLWSVTVLVTLLLTVWANSAWSVAVHIVAANGYAGLYFLAIFGSASGSLAASAAYFTLVDPTFEGILVGNLAGVAVTALVSVVAFRRGHLRPGVRRDVLARAQRLLGMGLAANFSDGVTPAVEKFTLVHFGGNFFVGIVTHAQAYRQMVTTAAKTFQLSSWPVLLRIGKLNPPPPAAVRNVGRYWSQIHFAMGLGGVGLALVIEDLVAVLTHGKFVEAAPLIMFYLPAIFVQYSGRLETAILFGNGQGNLLSRCTVIAAVFFAIAVIPAVWALGLYGAVAATFGRELIYRTLVVRYAARIRQTPFNDYFAIVACVMVVGASVLVFETDVALNWRIGGAILFALAAVSTALLSLRHIRSEERDAELAGAEMIETP